MSNTLRVGSALDLGMIVFTGQHLYYYAILQRVSTVDNSYFIPVLVVPKYSLLTRDPVFGVEGGLSLAHLELEGGIARIVGGDSAQNLVGLDLLTLLDAYL